MQNLISLNKGPTTVGTTPTPIALFTLNGQSGRASLQINNTGGTALNGLVIQYKAANEGAWLPLIGGTDFTMAVPGLLPFVSSTLPSTLAGGGTTYFNFLLSGAPTQCQILASVASGTTTIQTYGTAALSD